MGTSLGQVGFLAFQAFDEKPLPETQTPFYEILPVLTTALPAFERLNSFAETFAIVRWAKLSKAVVKPPAPPNRGEAKLFVFRLPSGDLVQSTHDLSPREKAALALADVRRVADATVSTLRAAGAPNDAQQRVGEVTASLQDKIRLELAMEELESIYEEQSERAPQIKAVGIKLSERKTEINYTLQKFSTKAQILIALALPSGKRKTAEQLYHKLSNANLDYVMAETDTRRRAAEIRVSRVRNALEKVLQPINQGKIKAESDLVAEKTKDVKQARTTFDEAVRTRINPGPPSSTWQPSGPR